MHLFILDGEKHHKHPPVPPWPGPQAILPQTHKPAPLVPQKVTPGMNFTLAHNQASPIEFFLSSPSEPENSSPGGAWVGAAFLFLKCLFPSVCFFSFFLLVNLMLLFYKCTLNNFTCNNIFKSSILRKYFCCKKYSQKTDFVLCNKIH